MYNLHVNGVYSNDWIVKVESTINNLGLSEHWLSQTVANANMFKSKVKLTLRDQFKQKWSSDVSNSSACTNYRLFKSEFTLENYLLNLPWNLSQQICKFRCQNNFIPIVRGRYINIDRASRKCTLCDMNDLGDEFHYLFKCPYFITDRKKFISASFLKYPNTLKFQILMSSTNITTLIKLAKFFQIILLKFKR